MVKLDKLHKELVSFCRSSEAPESSHREEDDDEEEDDEDERLAGIHV